MNEKILWYVADPMCSWCWGFAPVIEQVRNTYGHRLKVELLLGGLRPGTSHPLPSPQRQEILGHWQAVHRVTGQPFQFAGAMPEGFIYDTEPACRAVVVVSMLNPEAIFTFFRAVQSAFYVEQRNVTDALVLAELAGDVGLETQQFLQAFESDAARDMTQGHFHRASQLGVRGFPTLIGQKAALYLLISGGYCPLEELNPKIIQWLDT
ncbi:DsbA family protein [Nitrosospira sp. Nsp2]|uniref:DsbA family protein n=1 Tax=Nitrosospira sp. Nsp2 TaxID=136548 RepID=UPI000D311F94|nr:DsbA family protein [Nitrosospira sp. Nsp2]